MDGKTDNPAKDRDMADRQEEAADCEKRLDQGLKDSMDASDPPSSTKPGDHGEPVPSSGYTPQD